MRWPIDANGRVDTVLNTGAASNGSTYVAGVAISSANKLQLDTAAVGSDVVRVGGIAMKNTGVVYVATSGGTQRVGGLLVTDAGVLVVEAGGTPVYHVGGMPLNASGALCVSTIT